MKRSLIATGLVLFATAIPVIPEDLKFLWSYPYECVGSVQMVYDLENKWVLPEYSPEPCNGELAIAVFEDTNGNRVYQNIDKKRYEDMGKVDGIKFNPEKREFKSLIDEYILPKAKAAIVRGNNTTCNGSGTSCTFAHDIGSSDNRFLAVEARCAGSAATITSVTYNATALTIHNQASVTANDRIGFATLFTTAISGSNNIVINCSASMAAVNGRALSYSGASQSLDAGPISVGPTAATTTSYNTVTTVNANAVHVVGLRQDSGSGHTMTLCTIRTADGGLTIVDSNDVVSPAADTCKGSFTSSNTLTIGVSIFPSSAATFAPWQFQDF